MSIELILPLFLNGNTPTHIKGELNYVYGDKMLCTIIYFAAQLVYREKRRVPTLGRVKEMGASLGEVCS